MGVLKRICDYTEFPPCEVGKFNPRLAECWHVVPDVGPAQTLFWTAQKSDVKYRRFVLRRGSSDDLVGGRERFEYLDSTEAQHWFLDHGLWSEVSKREDLLEAFELAVPVQRRGRGGKFRERVIVMAHPMEKEAWSQAAREAGISLSMWLAQLANRKVDNGF